MLADTDLGKERKLELSMGLKVPFAILFGLEVFSFLLLTKLIKNIKQDSDTESKQIHISQYFSKIFLDSQGQDKLIIFYPGAKVEPKTYIPLMEKVAARGIRKAMERPQ